jgi:xanthine dehydrogenase accessory factor
VREYALRAIESGDALLLRIVPFADDEAEAEHGAVTVQNPCLSGGAIEVFLEPVLRAPRVLVEGDTPIVHALLRIGAELGLDMVSVDGEFEPRAGDLALVAAGHGREELPALRCALAAELPYVGLVASRKRGDGVLGELRGDGVPDPQLARIDTPAGLDIGSRTPGEIALSILARIVEVRRRASAPAVATTAVDPVCGMTVAISPDTLSLDHDGQTVYFCGAGCKAAFEMQHAASD